MPLREKGVIMVAMKGKTLPEKKGAMRMKYRKILSVLLAAALLAALFSACTSPMEALRNLFAKKEEPAPFAGLQLDKYINPGEYLGVAVEVSDEEIFETVNEYFDYYQQYGILRGVVDDPAKTVAAKGDLIVFDYEGGAEGVSEGTMQGMKAESAILELGSDSFILEYKDEDGTVAARGFEDQVIGQPRGKEFDVNVIFPDDYWNEELMGKPVVFKCTVRKIGTESTDEIMDEGVRMLTQGQTATVAEFLEEIKRSIGLPRALENAMEGAEYLKDLPKKEAEFYIQLYKGIAKEAGQPLEDYLLSNGYTDGIDMFKAEYNDDPVRRDLFAYAVAEKEGLEVTDDNWKEWLDAVRGQSGDTATTDDDLYANYGGKNNIVRSLMATNVSQFLYENAKK